VLRVSSWATSPEWTTSECEGNARDCRYPLSARPDRGCQARIQNSGEALAGVTVTYTVSGTEVAEVIATVEGGQTLRVDAKDSAVSSYGSLYTAENGGSVPVDVTVSGAGQELSESTSKDLGQAAASIQAKRSSFM
jgi:hypothetical protein